MTARRGSSNTNDRGSVYSRRARKWFLLAKFESPVFGPGWTHCFECDRLLCFETITVDRIIPGCEGGTYKRDNIRPHCMPCASKQGGLLAHRMKVKVPRAQRPTVGRR